MPSKRVLLVEGSNDKHVILALQGRRETRFVDKDEIVECFDCGRLLSSLPVRLDESDISQVGVVIDADSDLNARWNQIRHVLCDKGYANVPEQPVSAGTIIAPPPASILPTVGVWLMPDNRSSGILENFLRFLVPHGCRLFAHAETVLAGLPEKRFSQTAMPKALIHTWLAWQQDPGRPLGQAITARLLDDRVPEAEAFLHWIQRLFPPG
jgi:hypothetical protein